MTVDEFMSRIAGIESGGSSDPANTVNPTTGAHGTFQVLPSNWRPWAEEAGLGADAPRTAANQRKVARHKMRQYRDDYGSWEAAAVAWFAGPDRARRFTEGDQQVLGFSDGNLTVAEYVDRVRGDQAERTSLGSSQVPGGLERGVLPQDSGPQVPGVVENAASQSRGRASELWTHMIQQVAEQMRSGQGQEVPLGWIEPQPDNPINPGAEGDPGEPGDLGLASDGQIQASGTGPASEFLEVAQQFVGTPYVWGGEDPNTGFDCSGLIQYAAKQIGVNLPRVSRDQAKVGQEVPLGQAQPGDLVAFPARGQEVGHIGILVGRDDQGRWQMLHAPRSGQNVKVEPLGRRQIATVRRVFEPGSERAATGQQAPQNLQPQQTPREAAAPRGGQRQPGTSRAI
ncbi:MAG: C40 family peptidase [Jiangellaceae bacterium]